MRRQEEFRITVTTLGIVLVLATLHSCEAKRGCSAFGHSCFGGHGKRQDPSVPIGAASALEEVTFDQPSTDMKDVIFTAPRSVGGPNIDGYPPLRFSSSLVEPNRQLQNIDKDRSIQKQETFNELAPYLRLWMQAYRNSQDARLQNNI